MSFISTNHIQNLLQLCVGHRLQVLLSAYTLRKIFSWTKLWPVSSEFHPSLFHFLHSPSFFPFPPSYFLPFLSPSLPPPFYFFSFSFSEKNIYIQRLEFPLLIHSQMHSMARFQPRLKLSFGNSIWASHKSNRNSTTWYINSALAGSWYWEWSQNECTHAAMGHGQFISGLKPMHKSWLWIPLLICCVLALLSLDLENLSAESVE